MKKKKILDLLFIDDLESVLEEAEVEEPVGEEEGGADDGEVEELAEDETTEVDVVPGNGWS